MNPETQLDPTRVQHGIDQYWSRYAPDYEAHQSSRLRMAGEVTAWENVFHPVLPETPAKIMDAGTGPGNVAFILAGLGYDVMGMDLSKGMLTQAEHKAAELGEENDQHLPTFMHADAAAPPLPAASLDVITARYFLWTLRRPEQALANWFEVLKPGGRLVVVDSLWFPDGMMGSELALEGNDRMSDFQVAYKPALPDLPLAEATSMQEFVDLIAAAGFTDVVLDELPEIYELDRAHGVAPNHQVQMNYRVTARRP